MRTNIILITILSFVLSGCNNSKKSTTHIDSNFINAYIEIIVLQEGFQRSSEAYQDSVIQILHKNHFTEQTYAEMIRKYQAHPEDWEKFLEKVLKQIDRIDSTQIDTKNFSQQKLHEIIKKNRQSNN